MPRFSSIFLVNQTQKHKHKLISNKNTNTNTNTNLTTDLPCQPNTKTTNTNLNISKNTNTNPAIHLQKTCNRSSENPKNPNPNINPNPTLLLLTQSLVPLPPPLIALLDRLVSQRLQPVERNLQLRFRTLRRLTRLPLSIELDEKLPKPLHRYILLAQAIYRNRHRLISLLHIVEHCIDFFVSSATCHFINTPKKKRTKTTFLFLHFHFDP